MPQKVKAMLDAIRTILSNEIRYQKLEKTHRKALRHVETRVKRLMDYSDRLENRLELQRLEIERLKASNALKAREIIILQREKNDRT